MAKSRSESVKASLDKLKERGGDRKTWWLHPDSNKAFSELLELCDDKNGTSLINRLLLDERRRVIVKPKKKRR